MSATAVTVAKVVLHAPDLAYMVYTARKENVANNAELDRRALEILDARGKALRGEITYEEAFAVSQGALAEAKASMNAAVDRL